MRRVTGLLRRHGLTLVLTGAMVALYLGETVPALKERASLRARRAAAEAQLMRQRQQLHEGLLWLRVAEDDPFVQERFQDAHTWSPDIPGPRIRMERPVAPEVDEDGAPLDGREDEPADGPLDGEARR